MTLKDLLRDQGTEEQLRILMLADCLFAVGRYYGGQLTAREQAALAKVGR